jgi:serine O-acetyltransferase
MIKGRSLIYLYLFSKTKSISFIREDLRQWAEHIQIPTQKKSCPEVLLKFLMSNYPEFRNLFYFRIASDVGKWVTLSRKLANKLYPPLPTLLISTPEIGPGFFIQHGYSTIISARHIGRNCWVNQQVTIGYSGKNKYPTIGNNVRIAAGAKVIGEVNIGDNVVIGANAVVVKNVPPNCTVVGVPAYIVRRNGKRVHEELI